MLIGLSTHLQETVTNHSDKICNHADDDDIDVTNHISDRTAKHEEGQRCDHAWDNKNQQNPDGNLSLQVTYSHCPPHLQLGCSNIIKKPEEKTFNETPKDTGKHHHNQEEDNLTVLDYVLHIGKDPLARRLEIQP